MSLNGCCRISRREAGIWLAALGCLIIASPAASAQPGGQPGSASPAVVSRDASIDSLFVDFLHYAQVGRFTLADAFATTLLEHPELDAVRLRELADEHPDGIATLLILIKNGSIQDRAVRVLKVIQQGEHEKRQSSQRIMRNIRLLAGNPQQEFFAQSALRESGEYAIPLMVRTLLDPAENKLKPRVVSALPLIGKAAVNPLVIALAVDDTAVRLNLIGALGEIGYPRAIPYLRQLTVNTSVPADAQAAASRAIERIEEIVGRSFPGSPEDLFYELADRYYDEDDAVRADPRIDEANVWYFDGDEQALTRVIVPQRIFGQVMAMRCCEEALRLKNDHLDALALWLASNIRRESRLGMNVESGSAEEMSETDGTRPDVFPRALYFTLTAGPRYIHRVLDRAVRRHDSSVALGAIEALRVTAGATSLIGTEDYKQPLVEALQFPDPVVRIRAALALGAALPRSQFAGSALVTPTLAAALGQTGREQLLVVDANEDNGRRIAGLLRVNDREVAADSNFFRALERARTEFQLLSGVFVSTDVADPGIIETLRRLRGEFLLAKTPVVVMAKAQQWGLAMQLADDDPYVEAVDALAADADLIAAYERVRARTGQTAIDSDLARSMALQATETLRRIAVDGRTVFDAGDAEPALIAALASDDERLQTSAASVLALLRAPTAQRAVAHVALDDGNGNSLRIAAFGSLAESAKSNGNLLEEEQIATLVNIARDDADMAIRTAASQALGAISLTTNKASEIIRSYYGG